MDRGQLPPEVLELVAERFRALAEPARLQILDALRPGEKTVTELMEETGFKQANVSKHLQLLYTMGFVDRRKAGLNVFYRIVDQDVSRLCNIMCGRLKIEADRRRDVLETI